MRYLRRLYGAHPMHLLVILGCLALAGHAALGTRVNPGWMLMAVWFAAALLAHDLLLFPVYATADRLLVGAFGRRGVNYVRIPLLGSALTFAIFWPGIVRQGADTYLAATGLTQEPYLARWLLLCAGMFAVSALVLVVTATVRVLRRRGVSR
ncbi:MAG TPA: hypothetical protein VL595_30660 [Pseudonocardia sp.]|jgi:hypothetical protein|nr:hypothetical protein [Pseudonocardia sp.]